MIYDDMWCILSFADYMVIHIFRATITLFSSRKTRASIVILENYEQVNRMRMKHVMFENYEQVNWRDNTIPN